MANIKSLAEALGYLFYHTYDSRRSDAGFPDCVLVGEDGKIVWFELKSEKGKLTPAQWEWSRRLGERFYVIRPSDWYAGEIDRILK